MRANETEITRLFAPISVSTLSQHRNGLARVRQGCRWEDFSMTQKSLIMRSDDVLGLEAGLAARTLAFQPWQVLKYIMAV